MVPSLRQIFLLFFLLPFSVKGQNTIALPDIANYSKQQYRAGLQNWDIVQSQNGVLYIANNEGVLRYDGVYWKLYSLPNKTIVRSVAIGPDNRLFLGGQDEIGYFLPGKDGNLEYVSLTKLIPEKYRSFGDVWDIAILGKDVFFRSANLIFRYSNQTVSVYNAVLEWSYMGVCNGKLYAHDFQNGIYLFENEQWKPLIANNPAFQFDPVTAILPYRGDTCLVSTLKNGLFKTAGDKLIPFSTPAIERISSYRIYNGARLNETTLALATNQNGLQIINNDGQLLQSFTRQEGLQNNNILCVFSDREGNIWLGLDNGIAMISYSNPIKRLTPKSDDGAGYSAIIHANRLYAGTSGGLYSTALESVPDLGFSQGDFTEVANTTGQTWGLAEVNGHLLLGHHEGPFEIKNNVAKRILPLQGFWNFIPVSAVSPSPLVVAGHYKGLQFFRYENGEFLPASLLSGFSESSRFITLDNDDNIWVSHPYHGIFKITRNKDRYQVELYKDDKGLPSALNNHVYKLRNQVVIATEK
ncbi:MAG: two-component regulator propeller domain-containing protein, partial [Chitinophagaceae bacterium]